jgi:hypothetical protein
MEPKQAAFEGWAVIELFGHAREVGYVTTEAYGSAVLFRVDTPELPEREFVLEHPEYTLPDEKWTPAGAKVKRSAVPAKTRLIGPGAVYSIIPCTEQTARRAIENAVRRPLILLELPESKQSALLSAETEEIEEEQEEEDIEIP